MDWFQTCICWVLIILFVVAAVILMVVGLWGFGLMYLGGALGLFGVWGFQ